MLKKFLVGCLAAGIITTSSFAADDLACRLGYKTHVVCYDMATAFPTLSCSSISYDFFYKIYRKTNDPLFAKVLSSICKTSCEIQRNGGRKLSYVNYEKLICERRYGR